MAEVNQEKLIKLLKADEDLSQSGAAQKLGVTAGQLNMLTFCKAKVAAGVAKKAPPTPKSVRTLRDSQGERWEMIAARTGLSVAAVKSAYEEAGGDASSSYTGRGRNFSGATKKKTTTPKAQTAAQKAAAKKKAAAAKAKTGKNANRRGGAQIVRRRTRSGAGNPS